MIRRFDYWIGTRLFHPPIIWLCQRTGLTQHAVARYVWMVATLTFVARIGSGPHYSGMWFAVFATAMALLSTVTTALFPGLPTHPSFVFRLMLWAIGLVQLLAVVRGDHLGPDFAWEAIWTVLALTAEYAKTIITIPPRKRRERRTAAKEALS